jgi:hypothetical protein
MRVSATARNVKVQYPGNIGNLTQSLLPTTCNISNSRWNSIEYKELYVLGCRCNPCPVPEYFYDSEGAASLSCPNSSLDGGGIDIDVGTTLLDAGREC